MTSTEHTTNPAQSRENQGPPDLRPLLFESIDLIVDLVSQASSSDNFHRDTPCEEFDVSQLLDHLLGGLGRISQLARREEVVGELPAGEVDQATIVSQIRTAAAVAIADWADDTLMSAMLTAPFGTVPGAVAVAAYANEMLVHAWDLAIAIDVAPVWPSDQQIEMVLAGIQRALPAEGRENVPFGPAIEVAEDAPAIDRLAAWSGRVG